MDHIVGIGEYVISTDKEDSVKTFALSTCVGIVVYDTSKKILAMAHVLLPTAIKENNEHQMAKYADTALYTVFGEMKMKYNCDEKNFKVSLFGGIDSEGAEYYKVGERNIAVIKEILDKMSIKYDLSNTGGRVSRTITAYTATGHIDVKETPISNSLKLFIKEK